MFIVQDSSIGAFDTVVLRDEGAATSVTMVPTRGALVTSFVAHGREWLYLDEATLHDATQNVRGGIPVLFPSPGKLAEDTFSVDGATGRMKQHGFARTSRFDETGRGTDGAAWVELELGDSEGTRAQFPFGFRLRLRFALAGGRLQIRAEVLATGTTHLPFALGYHPYFAVARADKAQTQIPTAATRAWDNRGKQEISLDPRGAPLDLAREEVDLHLVDHGATEATLQTPQGAVRLDGSFPRWVIWTLPEKDFVCLEPWSAPANALNTGEGLVRLAPGEARVLELGIEVG